ncbi:MAG: 4Fe-4S binding protein [Clostridia bacterium]|nr:4Fe-4S binding protein [Clostridia bacterium]
MWFFYFIIHFYSPVPLAKFPDLCYNKEKTPEKRKITMSKLTPADIMRVKAFGCLKDKRFDDIFNVRVITRNGKITTDEQRAIAEAADRFGSGEVAMTTRLSIEIQGVKYDNIDALIEFLGEHGLETGGTGPLVRPVVSCKGTTCRFGLIDTYDLSEKIHERFYKGYHDVKLPHKFKIAVGGCPNNCVKPDLNDLGIIGQRVPAHDFDKCRGCKKCQVEAACPVGAAVLVDGKLKVDENACNHCGRCKNTCPFGVTSTYISGYKICLGGRWGKKTAHGIPLSKLFTSEDEVLDTIERTILLFRDEGLPGERFADTINRLGFEYVESKVIK